MRKISTELRPGILDDFGLAAAIEWQAKDFQRQSGVLCIVSVPQDDLDVSREQATAFFRIFQEILTNVARHSKAEKVWVQLEVQDRIVVLEVEDNGVGISPEALGRPEACLPKELAVDPGPGIMNAGLRFSDETLNLSFSPVLRSDVSKIRPEY